MKITSKHINYTVGRVDELLSLAGEEEATVVVTDENRGGVFIYRSANVGSDDGGTKFNGWTRQYDGTVNVRWFGAVGDGVTDDTSAIQSAIDLSIKQYDATETTYDETNVTYRGKQLTLYIPSGIYIISDTLNISFRNDWTINGDGRNTVIRWDGIDNGTMINARCSSHTKFSDLTLDGAHKSKNLMYQAGNGTHAANSKGNVTAINISNVHFWNQIAFADDNSYDPSMALLCLTSLDTADTWYYSVDDSVISDCRFSTNELNGGYSIAVSSSAVSINDCQMFSANGILVYNGADVCLNNVMCSLYSPPSSSVKHAYIKYGSGITTANVIINSGYLESSDYYSSGEQAIFIDSEPSIASNLTITATNCLIAPITQGKTFINLANDTYATLTMQDCLIQGSDSYGYIYAPKSSIKLITANLSTSTDTKNGRPLIPTAYASIKTEVMNPLGISKGEYSPIIYAEVGAVIDSNKYKYFSLQDTLLSLNNSDEISIGFLKNTSTTDIRTHGRIFMDLGAHTITLGGFKVENGSVVHIKNGTIDVSSYGFLNYGKVILENVTLTGSTIYNNGNMVVRGASTFNTTGICIHSGDNGVTKIDSDSCTFSGSGEVASIGTTGGVVILYSYSGSKPTTGLWCRGTKLVFALPSIAFPNEYFATADGVGDLAGWAHNGALAV